MEQRLENFERMLSAVQESYHRTVTKMEQLKQAGKEKTVTFRQLMGDKLTYQNMLSMYKIYGLLDDEPRER